MIMTFGAGNVATKVIQMLRAAIFGQGMLHECPLVLLLATTDFFLRWVAVTFVDLRWRLADPTIVL